MTRAISISYNVVNENRRHITLALLWACAFLLAVYGWNVYQVINHSLALKATNAEIAAASKSVQGLDAEYLALSSRLTPDTLSSYGLKEGQVEQYISRTTSLGLAATGREL